LGARRCRRGVALVVPRTEACGLLDGENACPPDDVGGASGYAYFLEAITDDAHEEHDDYVEWIGGPFDPAEFNLANANALCQKVH
jgi:hypothetical protein